MPDPTPPATPSAAAPAAKPAEGAAPDGTKVIAGLEVSRRVVHAQKTIEAERKKLAAERAEVEAWRPKIKGYEEAANLAKTNRKEFLSRMGITAVEAAQLFDLVPKTAEAAAVKPVDEMTAKELAQLKEDLAAIRKEREAEKAEATKAAQARSAAEAAEWEKQYVEATAKAVSGDDHPYVTAKLAKDATGTKAEIWEVARALYQAFPDKYKANPEGVPSAKDILTELEKSYEADAEVLGKVVKKPKEPVAASLGAKPAAATTDEKKPPPPPRKSHLQVMAELKAEERARRAAKT